MGDDWNPLLWDSPDDAIRASVRAYRRWGEQEAAQQFASLSSLIRLSMPEATLQDEYLHFYNLVETYRNGGTYEQWLEQTAITS